MTHDFSNTSELLGYISEKGGEVFGFVWRDDWERVWFDCILWLKLSFFFTDFFVISMSLILNRLNLAARKDWFIQIKKIMQLYFGVQINCNTHKTSHQILLLIFSEFEWINPVAFLKFLWNFKSFGSVNQLSQYYPATSCLFKFNDIVNFEYISLLVLVFLFLTLSR